MTVKEIAEAVGKTDRAVRGWVRNAGLSRHGSSMYPADFNQEDTLKIISTGLGKMPEAIYRAALTGEKFDSTNIDSCYSTSGVNGFVYLCYDSGSGYTKIGMTSNGVQQRLSTMRVSNPKLEIIAILKCDNPRTIERELHQQWRGSWVCGEWFNLKRSEIDSIVKNTKMVLAIEEGVAK